MADLLTHYALSRIVVFPVRNKDEKAAFILGSFLPDLLAKTFVVLFASRSSFASLTHSIVGAVIFSYLVSLFFESVRRHIIFLLLIAGSLFHILVDLFKYQLGAGGCHLLIPISFEGAEIGMYNPTDIVYIMPLGLVLLLLVIFLEREIGSR